MKRENKLRVVIDTNLIISALIVPDSTPNKLIRAWQNNLYVPVISHQLINELEEVSKRNKFKKYHLLQTQMNKIIENFKSSTELAVALPIKELPLHSRDPKDDKLLSCAFGANADYLISGDLDILDLNGNTKLGKLKIISAKEFLDLFSS